MSDIPANPVIEHLTNQMNEVPPDPVLSFDNAKQHKTNRPLKILCVGPGGQGKTALATTIPGKKFAYIFDQTALPTIDGTDIDYKVFLSDDIPTSALPLAAKPVHAPNREKRFEPTTYIDFEGDIQARLAANFFDDYDCLIIDSFTMLADLIMDYILFLNGRPGQWPNVADWTASINTLSNIFRKLTGLGIPIYCTAHTDYEKDESSGRMVNQLQMSARLRSRIPMMFSDIWLAQASLDAGGKSVFSVQTASDRINPFLRNSFRGKIESIVDVTIRNWDQPENSGIGKILKATSRGMRSR